MADIERVYEKDRCTAVAKDIGKDSENGGKTAEGSSSAEGSSVEMPPPEEGGEDTTMEMIRTEQASHRSPAWDTYVKLSNNFVNLFPIWTVVSAGLALWKPALFSWFGTPYFTASLAILMLSMGITLSINDFLRVFRRMGAVAVGFAGCYALMPALAYALARGFSLSPALLAGVVLVGCVNGGQASNLCTYIANGNVALSVLMTTVTTISAIFMTPLLSKIFVGAVVPVNAIGIAVSTIQVVLLPIAVGMLLNRFANRAVKLVLPFSPVVGVISTVLLVGSSVAQCASSILAAGWTLQVPILLLHLMGGYAGYYLTKVAGYNEIVRRTVAIETAMKSSAFAFLLATLHFPMYEVRIPAAASLVWMALTGSTLAVIWRYIPIKSKTTFDRSLAQSRGRFDDWVKKSLKESRDDL
eukprot:CAMPEP_0198731930 /NCGR_PEP_ID=MMETSP1475-20131203/32921_1 /TAXON_ID= ORGANISM="Unidentified sp., Strain CCMP1999" /NCGR_SAMPLE_ID=MMETSP1475 /ASSEMBLY_ACC=CAM_ASM_001111 /LENGTH=412 /DNA_ID=CAMNT_0044494957 /DNA_START=190 /DNA_END=1429 /DNA_ORIENTATION=-